MQLIKTKATASRCCRNSKEKFLMSRNMFHYRLLLTRPWWGVVLLWPCWHHLWDFHFLITLCLRWRTRIQFPLPVRAPLEVLQWGQSHRQPSLLPHAQNAHKYQTFAVGQEREFQHTLMQRKSWFTMDCLASGKLTWLNRATRLNSTGGIRHFSSALSSSCRRPCCLQRARSLQRDYGKGCMGRKKNSPR